ncbi:outer membrane beta-barrel protein [Paucibacter soli]|uniref:outer membrane beta-barrel protein n=1 Tax=Paucibacter soli TaxID=3133433 RepID=UPI0030B14BA8
MNARLQTRLTMLLAIAAACVMTCRAEADVLVGPYAGANAGLYSRYELSCDQALACDRSARLSGKVYGGYAFGQFGFEAMAYQIGAAQGQAGTLRSSGVALLGVLPLNSGDFTFKGKLGLAYARGTARQDGASSSKSSVQPVLGTSFAYTISKSVSVNADWDQLRAKTGSEGPRTRINMFSLGLSVHF